MKSNVWLYILIMSAVTLSIRILPLTLIRKQIRSRLIRSFLFYMPYATLAVMTFPDILHASSSPWSGAAALLLGMAAAWFGSSLFQVAVYCCLSVFLLEFLI